MIDSCLVSDFNPSRGLFAGDGETFMCGIRPASTEILVCNRFRSLCC